MISPQEKAKELFDNCFNIIKVNYHSPKRIKQAKELSLLMIKEIKKTIDLGRIDVQNYWDKVEKCIKKF